MMRRQQEEEEYSRAFYELSALVLNLLRSPPAPIHISDRRSAPCGRPITAAGLASLMLGVSLTLMIGGSVSFVIGFVLMPWVLGLVMVFYVAGLVSTLSVLGRSIICYATAPSMPPKIVPIPAWKLL